MSKQPEYFTAQEIGWMTTGCAQKACEIAQRTAANHMEGATKRLLAEFMAEYAKTYEENFLAIFEGTVYASTMDLDVPARLREIVASKRLEMKAGRTRARRVRKTVGHDDDALD